MRIKDLTKFVGNDLLDITGVARGSRQAQRLFDVLKPKRSRTPGEAIEISLTDIAQGFLTIQMWRGGASDELARFTCNMIPRWIHRDRLVDQYADAGLVVILRDRNGEAYLTRYIPRADWEAQGWEAIRTLFHRPLEEPYTGPRTPGAMIRHYLTTWEPTEPTLYEKDPSELENLRPTSYLLFDLKAIFEDARSRIEAFREKDSLPGFSVEQLLDACTLASQVRDQVDSVEDDKEKASGNGEMR
jgi:hypothetical protein